MCSSIVGYSALSPEAAAIADDLYTKYGADMLPLSAVIQIFNLSRSSVCRRVASNEIPGVVKVGGVLRFPLAVLASIRAHGTAVVSSPPPASVSKPVSKRGRGRPRKVITPFDLSL